MTKSNLILIWFLINIIPQIVLSNPIISSPSSIKLNPNSNTFIELTYLNPISIIQSIILIDVNDKHETHMFLPISSIENKVSFIIPHSTSIISGLYTILTIFNDTPDDNEQIEPTYPPVIIYRNALSLVSSSLRVDNESMMSSIKISFKNKDLFNGRIKTIKIGKTVIANDQYEVDSLDSAIILKGTEKFKYAHSRYKLVIEDIVIGEPPVVFTIEVMRCPSGAIFKNGQCQFVKKSLGISYNQNNCPGNYCDSTGAIECLMINDKPSCKCKQGYYGIKCAIPKDKIIDSFINTITVIFQYDDLTSIEAQNDMITVSSLLKYNETLIKHVIAIQTSTIHSSILKVINAIQPNEQIQQEAFTSICFVLNFLALKHQYTLPSIDTSDKKAIESILSATRSKINDIMVLGNPTKINFLIDEMNPILFYQIWDNTPANTIKMTQNAMKYSLAISDFNDSFKDMPQYVFCKEELSIALAKIVDRETIDSNHIMMNVYDSSTNSKVDLSDDTSGITMQFIPGSQIGIDNLIYYADRDIDIYDPLSKAFTEECYFNKKFNYDLVQEQRKFYLYQNKTITSINPNCKYEQFDMGSKRLVLQCSISSFTKAIGYHLTEYFIPNIDHNNKNLPTLCVGKGIDDIQNNFAFWVYLWGSIIYILISLLLLFLKCRYIMFYNPYKSFQNDLIQLYGECNIKAQVTITTQVSVTDLNKDKEDKVFNVRSFSEILSSNFTSLHSLLSIGKESLFTPPHFKLSLFFSNFLSLFGFNALLYNEQMIDHLRLIEERTSFVYVMRYEYDKLLYSIIACVALTLLVRLITLVTNTSQKILSLSLDKTGHDDDKITKW